MGIAVWVINLLKQQPQGGLKPLLVNQQLDGSYV
jgi:hypothetical protein